MRRSALWMVAGGLIAASCFLPDVAYDPTVGVDGEGGEDASGGTGGKGGTGGLSGGKGGKGGSSGTSSGGTGGKGGTGGSMGGAGGDSGAAGEDGSGGSTGGRGGNGGTGGGTGGNGGTGGGNAGQGGTGGNAGTGGGGAGQGGGGMAGAGQGGNGGSAGGEDLNVRETKCIDYCQKYFAACGTHETNTYADETDCAETCFVPEAQGGWPIGTLSTQGSVECRRVHAGYAVDTGMLDPHCFHSAEVPSKGQCEVIAM